MMLRKPLVQVVSKSYIHQSSAACQAYQVDYGKLRGGAGQPPTPPPKTVKGNVKNFGWKGGAQRGFLAAYPDCIHVLTSQAITDVPDIAPWYRKILTHNLSSSVLRQRYGILVPITYLQLCPTASKSKDDMNLAHVLAWCVELIRAAAIVTTDTVALQSNVRYGIHKPDAGYVTWADKHELGNKAFNDALLIERSVFVLLKHYFGDKATLYYEPITRAQRSRALGRALGFSLFKKKSEGNRLDDYTIANYKALTKSHVSQTNYCLPISLALHLSGMHDPKLHELAHTILHEMGYYIETTRDFIHGFDNPSATDIQDGRLTWLIALALQRANPEQRKLLDANYGCGPDLAKAEVVQQIYTDLKLKKLLKAHIEEKKEDILNRIQGISKLDKAGLSQEFFFKLLENMDANDIQ